MANNYLLKYKTYDELVAEVMGDFSKYAANNMIDSSQLIKVAQKINKRLGDKLRKEKEVVLYVEKGRVRLPADFHRHLFSTMCYNYKVTGKVPRGDQREYREVETVIPMEGCAPACAPVKPCVRLTACGGEYQLIETTLYETRTYNQFGKLTIANGKSHYRSSVSDSVINNGYIENNFLYTNFTEGTIYLNYLGNMEDEDGNLLVLDHELINDYYEYSLKQRIVELLTGNGEIIPQNLFQIIETRFKAAKVEADSLISMPDFAEMKLAHDINRKAMYQKFYHIFQ